MHPAEGRGAVFGGSGLICDFAVASAVLPVLTTAHRYDSHDTAPYGKLYPDFGGAVASFLLYVAAGRDYGKADVYDFKSTSKWTGGRTRQPDVYTGIVGF